MASDSFTDDDGTGLESHDANWTGVNATYPVTNLEINSNVCEHEAGWQKSSAYYSTSSEDESEIDFEAGSSGTTVRHVSVRMGSDQLGYAINLGLISGGNYTRAYATKNGGYLDSLDTGSWAVASKHAVKSKATGTSPVTIEGFVDSVSVGDTNDSSSPIASGCPGFWTDELGTVAEGRYDDWTDNAGAAAAIDSVDGIDYSTISTIDGPSKSSLSHVDGVSTS